MQPSAQRLGRAGSGILVVDIQERLLPAIFERERVLENALRLVQGAAVLNVPVLVTEQYRKGLGATVPSLAAVTPNFAPIEKLDFSACGVPGVIDQLKSRKLRDLVVCGIEAHVCVCQTCLDLLQADVHPFVVADAVSSRTPENWRLGLERMRDAGATIVSTEMVLFELLERAGTDEFKRVLPLVK